MDWIDKLVEELGLGDTVPPNNDDDTISIIDVIRRTQITPEGWTHTRRTLLEMAGKITPPTLFQDIMESDPALFTALISVIKIPYILCKSLKYPVEACEQLSLLTAFALTIAMAKGYSLGQGMEGPGKGRGKGPGKSPQPK